MRIASIDVGTNTALLLIADAVDGRLTPLHEDRRFVRLGQGVDATGRVGAPALERLRSALLAYREEAERWEVDLVTVGATSASRDAENREELVRFVAEETGFSYEILSGEEEAAWTFAGAVSALDDVRGAVLVLDIGGGSTEAVVGLASEEASGRPPEDRLTFRCSMNVGSVRLTERFLSARPPTADEIRRAEAFTRSLMEGAGIPSASELTFVGAAGTLTSLALLHGGAKRWEELAPEQTVLAAEEVTRWRERLLRRTPEEVLALNPEVMAGRADVFAAGVLILDVFMRTHGLQRCVVTPRGLRHGLALRASTRRR